MKNKFLIILFFQALLMTGLYGMESSFNDILLKVKKATTQDELNNIAIADFALFPEGSQEYQDLEKAFDEKMSELIVARIKGTDDIDDLIALRRDYDAVPDQAEAAFERRAKELIDLGAVKLAASHGKIIGGKDGKVWAAIVALKKKLPGTNLPKDVITVIATGLFDGPELSAIEKLNLALELAADPQFVNAEEYFKNVAKHILKSDEFYNPYIEEPEIDVDFVEELGYNI